MKRITYSRTIMIVMPCLVLISCGTPRTPTPHLVATQVAMERAVAATLTAEAPTATNTPEPTETSTPTTEPTETSTPAPTPTPTPIVLTGTGSRSTEEFTLPSVISIAKVTVQLPKGTWADLKVSMGGKTLLTSSLLGTYEGECVLTAEEPVSLQIDIRPWEDTPVASWSIIVRAMGYASSALFEGKGDAVSDLFDPPEVLKFVHWQQLAGPFSVWLICAGGKKLAVDVHGDSGYRASQMVITPEGLCFWLVNGGAGGWSLIPTE